MKNLKKDVLEWTQTKTGSSKGWRILLAFVMVVSFGVAPTQLALADPGGVPGHIFNVTFTKWISTWPNMVGFVGGDVGSGTFAGEVLNYLPGYPLEHIEAMYHFYGGIHSFTAHVYVIQNDVTGTASIVGRVTEGWLKGAPLTGEYKVWVNCPSTPPGNSTMCFQGGLSIQQPGS